ncbi:MAG TPA: MltA domain-containing protein [Burkholderiales bacterium]|nr:MltA domain-containing protein [Burkholderiales bacterium]
MIVLVGCASAPKSPPVARAPAAAACEPAAAPTPPPPPAAAPAPLPITPANNLRLAAWGDLPGWPDESLTDAFVAFLHGCLILKGKPEWQTVCADAATLPAPDQAALKQFFERAFALYAVVNPDGSAQGLITGYYEPVLHGSRRQSAKYRQPVYGVPDDLLVVDLSEVYPDLKNLRLRGRIDGRRVVPYYTRAEIDAGKAPVAGREILWVEDSLELFFLQVQGSGKVVLDTGEVVRVSYADQNGHPYRSVGRVLVERGELTLDQASMQGIKAWAARNPDKVTDLLDNNASYIFFREQPADGPGPNGALGIPLTPGRSLAVDPRAVPLGAPVFLSATWPNSQQPLNRLMVAQDTGGAIKGAVRGDFYWGSGEEAGAKAGRMRQNGRMWALLPTGFPLAATASTAANGVPAGQGRASLAASCVP